VHVVVFEMPVPPKILLRSGKIGNAVQSEKPWQLWLVRCAGAYLVAANLSDLAEPDPDEGEGPARVGFRFRLALAPEDPAQTARDRTE
jgi:hypothetical protein